MRWINVGLTSLVCIIGVSSTAFPDGALDAATELAQRLLGERAAEFAFEAIPQENGLDVFEVTTPEDRVVLRGSSGVAMASALNHYFKHYCNASFSLCGSQLELPSPLPRVPAPIRVVCPFKYRYCFNYCCFSYSMAWWDWAQWERVIDWMALNGINLPLAVTGQEAVWQEVYREMGLTEQEILEFIVGPAYLPFGWMGCIDGWGGPLGQDWIEKHRALEEKILARERALGMTPVLQGFTGHVPAALKAKFPDAKFQQLPSWCDFSGTIFVDPQEPLFRRIGQAFVEAQTKAFGTDHLYASDTFIEMSPPSKDPEFLAGMARAVYEAMAAGDPKAVWVMQGWLFVNNPNFWQPPQAKALFGAVPNDGMLVLDLFCEARPAWEITESFRGKPWIWCIIQNFGNQVSLHGGLPQIVANLVAATNNSDRGRLEGMGYIMEGLGNNPVVYDLMNDLIWRPGDRDLETWIREYAARRYGKAVPEAEKAWRGLLQTVYRQPQQIGSIITRRPQFAGGACPYSVLALARAGQQLLACADILGGTDTYGYDVVHVTRQILCNHALVLHAQLAGAYRDKDQARFRDASRRFLELIADLDELLGTRPEFLLGRWLEDAKRWAINDEERRRYEWNARNQITLWGPRDSGLHDYAAKQWSGMMTGFYAMRWRMLFEDLERALDGEKPFDKMRFEAQVRTWEEQWTHGTENYPDMPQGEPAAVARRIWAKYETEILAVEVPSLTTGKPAACSGSLANYPAPLANDGLRENTNSYWATDVQTDPASWWQVDLEEPAEVGRVVVVAYYGDERSYEFTVETSMDGEAWEPVADFRGKPQLSTREGISCSFAPRAVRFIRVTVTNNSANTGRHLVEVMAYPE